MKLKYVLIAQLLVIFSMLLWRMTIIQYDMGAYDTLQASNFEGSITTLLLTSMLLLYILIKSRERSLRLFFTIICFVILYSSPFIANFPYYTHRDVYLHLPYSLQILSTGGILRGNWEVFSFPGSYVYYALLAALTGLRHPEVIGAYMNIPYTIVMVVILYYLAVQMETSQIPSIYIVFLLLPFISGFAPAPSFPHRYQLAFILSVALIGVLLSRLNRMEQRYRESVITMTLILATIVFTHPYFSTYIVLALLVYGVELLITMAKNTLSSRSWIIIMFISIAVIYAIHIVYIADPIMLRETYSWFLSLNNIHWFIETSAPINVVAQNEYVENLAFAIRVLWRVILFAILVFALSLHLFNLVRRRGSICLSLAFAVSAVLISIPLIVSFLWWERSLTFIGLALVISMYEGIMSVEQYHGGEESKILEWVKRTILILVLLAVLIAPLIRWERQLLPDMWQGSEKTALHRILCFYTDKSTNSIYVGVYTGVEYTYCAVYLNPNAPKAISIFDARRSIWIKDPVSINGFYVVSAWDTEFNKLNLEEMYTQTSIVWSSFNTYIFRRS